jgi:hypothetical protein
MRMGTQNTIVSLNTLGPSQGDLRRAHVGKVVDVLDVGECDALFTAAAAHEERVTKIKISDGSVVVAFVRISIAPVPKGETAFGIEPDSRFP